MSPQPSAADSYVDGNALGGALSLAFGTDMTAAAGTCGHCGLEHPLAESRVYLRCPGMVMRCPGCSHVEIVMVEIDNHINLTVRGLATITLGRYMGHDHTGQLHRL